MAPKHTTSQPSQAPPAENLNLPLGPVRVGEEWRANARVGLALHCSLLWTAGRAQQLAVVYVSPVLEKSADFTCYLLSKVIEVAMAKGMLKQHETFTHWSDGATSYRSIRRPPSSLTTSRSVSRSTRC